PCSLSACTGRGVDPAPPLPQPLRRRIAHEVAAPAAAVIERRPEIGVSTRPPLLGLLLVGEIVAVVAAVVRVLVLVRVVRRVVGIIIIVLLVAPRRSISLLLGVHERKRRFHRKTVRTNVARDLVLHAVRIYDHHGFLPCLVRPSPTVGDNLRPQLPARKSGLLVDAERTPDAGNVVVAINPAERRIIARRAAQARHQT